MNEKKMRVAIIGQGRSGRDIHGRFFQSAENELCEVVCVVEADADRRARAREEYGCDTAADYTELFARKDIDVVVNATYSHMHYAITKDLLSHGFSVLCEKPLARTLYECEDLILTAKRKGVVLAVFHQSLLNPAFLKIKEIIGSGKLGNVIQINLKYSGFARRWDWQTLQCCCAGGLYNTGPHPLGQALDLLEWDPNVRVAFSSLHTVLTSGDSDDYAKVILTAPGRPNVDVEVISADAYAGDYTFKIYGSGGTLTATNSAYKMKYIEDFSVYPARPVQKGFLSKPDGMPLYCSEKLRFTEEAGDISGTSFDVAVKDFYAMLHRAVMNGEALDIPAERAAQVIAVVEYCHAQNPLPVKFD